MTDLHVTPEEFLEFYQEIGLDEELNYSIINYDAAFDTWRSFVLMWKKRTIQQKPEPYKITENTNAALHINSAVIDTTTNPLSVDQNKMISIYEGIQRWRALKQSHSAVAADRETTPDTQLPDTQLQEQQPMQTKHIEEKHELAKERFELAKERFLPLLAD